MSLFEEKDMFTKIPYFPMDQIERTNLHFQEDKSREKIYLGSGELQNEENKTYQFQVVSKAEEKIYKSGEILNKDYLFPQGDDEFTRLARDLCFGTKKIENGKKIFSIQTQGATGAIRLAFSFLKKYMNAKMYIPCPSWPLARLIAEEVGLQFEDVHFFDVNNQQILFDNLISKLKNAENKSLLFMQDIANSPTGEDPSMDQWKQIVSIVKDKQIRVVLDSAFQGYSSGDIESDSKVVQLFLKEDIPFFVAQTFSKNLGLYGERIGCLHIVSHSSDDVEKIKSQFEHRVRCLWLSPSLHGSQIVKAILKDKDLFKSWKEEFQQVQNRLKECRRLLQDSLVKVGAQGKWDNITKHCGMFVLLPLNEDQCNFLREKHHLYIMDMGRINISSINRKDIHRLAQGIKEAIDSAQQ
jgi:aspartate/tyrosine/aromatic aminotransferase